MSAMAGCLAMLVYGGTLSAGERTWTQDRVSSAINHKNVPVVVRYTPNASVSRAPTARITRVQATRAYKGKDRIQTLLCWNGTSRCVHLTGASVSTHEFDGLDAGKPIYLVHTTLSDKPGPMSTPIFVKGSVVVWYGP